VHLQGGGKKVKGPCQGGGEEKLRTHRTKALYGKGRTEKSKQGATGEKESGGGIGTGPKLPVWILD